MREVAHAVDAELEAQDVRLTMGGEPTFVGIDEPESPQWNIDALGDHEAQSRTGADSGLAREDARPAQCCITGKGSGIPASPCRAGR